jgi:hypothetical protein
MKIRLYMDEDAMSRALATALRKQGIEVNTARDAGMMGYSDEQHLKYVAEQGYVLYSFNAKDFYSLHTRLLKQGLSHAGIVLAPQGRYSVGEQMRRLLRLIAAKSAEEMIDQVEFLSAWG